MLNRREFLGAATLSLASLGASRCRREPERVDVLILGGGLAGLNAAQELIDAGLKVLILEARNRAGGRVLTLKQIPGSPEAGATQISTSYKRFVALAERYEVELRDAVRSRYPGGEFWISLDGQAIRAQEWAEHDRNPFSGVLAQRPPWALPFSAFAGPNPLPEVASWRDPSFAHLDVSIGDYLGWNQRQLDFAFGINPGYGPDADSQSALMWLQIARAFSTPGGKLIEVQGGNDAIPLRMAEAFEVDMRYGAVIRSIDVQPQGVSVATEDGRRFSASFAVSTLPTAALRQVSVSAPLTTLQRQGIEGLNYNRVVRAYFTPTRKFWEEDGLPPSIWSDSLAGRVFALRGNGGTEITGIQSFVTGPAADRLDTMTNADALTVIQRALEEIRPSCRGALVPQSLISWGADPFAGGAYACWQPGQISGFANALAKPAGRLLFAGEHTARAARGVEGALESGERAAREILAA